MTAAPERPAAEAPAAVAPPPGHPRFPLVDSLRAVAAIAVLVNHAVNISVGNGPPTATWEVVPQTMDSGLSTFFVISGFLLYRPFVNTQLNGARRTRTRDYARRRVLRIVPAYWVALTVLAAAVGLAGVFTGQWWRFYLMLGGYDQHRYAMGLIVAWTLAVELTFYALLPLYAAALGRLARGRGVAGRIRLELFVLGALSAGSFAVRAVDFEHGRHIAVQQSLLVFVFWFALGMALAVLSAAVQAGHRVPLADRIAARPGLAWAGALVVFVALCLIDNPEGTHDLFQWIVGYYALGGLLGALLLLPAVFPGRGEGWPHRVLAWRPLAWAGLVSYGIYLYHVPLLTELRAHVTHEFFALALLGLVASVACAAASYYVVERPILRFKYRGPRAPRRRAAGQAA